MSSRVKNRLVVLGAVVLAMGGIAYSIVVSAGAFRRIFREPRPTQMTCDQFLARRPAAEWLRLTQCRIDATSPVYKRRGTTIEDMWIAVRVRASDGEEPAPILFETFDLRLRELIEEHDPLFGGIDDDAWARVVEQNRSHLWRIGEIEGIVVPQHVYTGVATADARRHLAAPDAVHIAESRSPFLLQEVVPPLVAFAFTVLVGAMIAYSIRQRERLRLYEKQKAAAAAAAPHVEE